jgi:hypothetical protein
MRRYSIERISFEGPEGLAINSIGPDAWQVVLGARDAWLDLVLLAPDLLEAFPEAVRMQSFKATYLGVAKPAERAVTRTILDRPITGEALSSTVPRPVAVEAFLVPLPDGGALFFGARRVVGAADAANEAFIAGVAASLSIA